MTPNGFGDKCLLVGVRAIAPVVLSKSVPQPFDRIEFRRVGRKKQLGDLSGPPQLV